MLVWRPIMAGKVTLGEVRRGEVDIYEIEKLNSLLDLEAAMRAQAEKAK